MIHSPNRVVIDLFALIHNLNQVKRLIDPKTRIMAIVKSDAYGHGLLKVSKLLVESGVYALGVAHIQEALELRMNGIKIPIVILCGIRTREDARNVVDNDLVPVIFGLKTAEMLNEESVLERKRIKVHLKVDTGMGRLGISVEELVSFLKRLTEYKGLQVEALTSHLSSADERERRFTEIQVNHFKKAIEIGQSTGLRLPLNNLANSAGIMSYRESHFEMVRPGIMLYGGLPSPEFKSPLPLRPAMNFTGEILQIREFPDRTPISYGRTYHTKGSKRIAVLSAGYGDGIPRSLSNQGDVIIGGKRAPIVGRLCMNMMMSDVTELERVTPGDDVIFLGMSGDEVISGDHMAAWSETISYEIFCSIGQRHNREYLS